MSRAPRVSQQTEIDDYISSWHATMQLLREGKSFSGRERNRAFLNTGGDRFANVSALSGLDFADDGRAIAAVDWDHDGDLDFWIHNRTGPRLRFMRNQNVQEADGKSAEFIAIRLRGTQSNRDAIGARVQVNVAPDEKGVNAKPLAQTVAAGDGYLSQSSKWLHFGLGTSTEIASIDVRWPNGNMEQFAAVSTGRRYRLTEGQGIAKAIDVNRSGLTLNPRRQPDLGAADTVRVQFANPVPLPILSMSVKLGGETSVIKPRRRALLIVLWASWCPNCLEELQQLQAIASKLDNAGIEILALNVDALATTGDEKDSNAEAVLRQLGFTHATGFATAELMDKLQLVQRIVLNRPLESAVPTMLMVNRNNELTGLYQGVQSVDGLVQDAQFSSTTILRRERSIPFPGRWTTPPDILLLRPVATIFADAGYQADYEHFLELDRERLATLLANASTDAERQRLEVRFANDSFDLAMLLVNSGRAAEAIGYFEAGLKQFPDSGKGRLQYGRALTDVGDTKAAMEQFQAAVELAPDDYRARFQLGVAAAASRDADLALQSFRRVVEQRPQHIEAWINLGTLLAQLKRSEEAVAALRKATQLDPTNTQAALALGGQLARSQQFREASEWFRAATNANENQPQAFAALGQCLAKLNEDKAAMTALRRAIELNPSDAASRLQVAWLQSTSPIDALRDGPTALQTAIDLARRTQNRDPNVLDTLAAASAEVGKFEQAVKAATAAISLLPPTHPLRADIQARLATYGLSKPHRRSPEIRD